VSVGGRSGIRTHERVAPLTVFKTVAFVRSAILPDRAYAMARARALPTGTLRPMASEPGPVDPFASPARLRELIERLPVAVYVDTDDRVPRCLYASPNVEALLGYPPERITSEHDLWWQLMHPDDRDRVVREYGEAWETGTAFRSEYRVVRPDGSEAWVRDSTVPVLGSDGRRLAWHGVLEDITEAKRAAQEIQESEARYRALVERTPAVVYEMGPDDERRTLYVSPHVEEVLGYSRLEWLDQPDIWIELLHADDREIVLDRHDRHTRTGEPWDLEYRLIANDGRVVWVHDRGTLIRGIDGRPAAWHGVMIDVTAEHEAREMLLLTKEDLERRIEQRAAELEEANELMSLEIGERRRIERELRQARQRYQRLVEDLPGVVYLWEATPRAPTRRFTYLSPQLEAILGFSAEEWSVEERLHPHDRERVARAVARSSRTGEPLRQEYRYLAKDGSVVWVLDHASLVSRTPDGEPALFQGVMLSVTERKRAESEAAVAEDRLRALTERGPVVMASLTLQHDDANTWPPAVELTYVSPQVSDLTGYSAETLRRDPETWVDLIHPDDRARVLAARERSFSTGEDWRLRYRLIRADGTVIWIHSIGRMFERDATGRPWRFQAVLFEVTEEQEELQRIERSDAQLRVALDGTRAIPWTSTFDPDDASERYAFIGTQATEILGYTPDELTEERGHFLRIVHPDDRDRVRRSSRLASETGIWDEAYRVIRRDGDVRWLHSFGRRASTAGEVPQLWHGVAIDVTPSRSGRRQEDAVEEDAARAE
jgi:PAS domain S-box-containing protein